VSECIWVFEFVISTALILWVVLVYELRASEHACIDAFVPTLRKYIAYDAMYINIKHFNHQVTSVTSRTIRLPLAYPTSISGVHRINQVRRLANPLLLTNNLCTRLVAMASTPYTSLRQTHRNSQRALYTPHNTVYPFKAGHLSTQHLHQRQNTVSVERVWHFCRFVTLWKLFCGTVDPLNC
jgi:hypothetical protein